MKINISYSKKADKFLLKNTSLITEKDVDDLLIKAVKLIYKFENINLDLKRLKGDLKDYFRIRKGKIRIVFKVIKNEIILISVEIIDFRGEVYKV